MEIWVLVASLETKKDCLTQLKLQNCLALNHSNVGRQEICVEMATSRYGFSAGVLKSAAILKRNVNEQISETIIGLKDKIDVLKQIKAMYDVNFGIMIVPNIFDGEQPCLSFGKEIIEFCYLSATDIQIDT